MINEYENLLRLIIIEILSDDVSKYKIISTRTNKWEEKKIEETKKNKGVCNEPRLIYYSDFYDLKTIIVNDWQLFAPIFMDKKRFEIFFDEIEGYRNTVAHGRQLIKSQNLLLEGILLDTKNLKTMYHNKNEGEDDYFIRISKVSDNLGNVWTSNLDDQQKPNLRVGDEYEILIEANDPKDREMEYEISSIVTNFKKVQKENRFNFAIGEQLIGKHIPLLITVRTPASDYKNEVLKLITLSVLPK